MKAVVCTKYGPPEVLELREIEKPSPEDHEILVSVRATSVTAGDIRARSFNWASWFWLPGRILYGFLKPRRVVPGNEFSGEIEAVGKNVSNFKIGDQVFGIIWDIRFGGACAEYICVPENEIAIKPRNMTNEEAATVPIGALTALVLLRKANIQHGQKILIVGASGSVGTFAVQLAKYLGAEVTGVCSAKNLELVKSLGADLVIDYSNEDFKKSGKKYDVIFDAVMKTSFSQCKNSLVSGGVFATVDWPLHLLFGAKLLTGKRVIFGIAQDIEDLSYLANLIEAGKITTVIDRTYPLEKIVDAHRYAETGHKRGNVAITVGER